MPTLDWEGKQKAIEAAKKVPYRLLEYDSSLSCGSGENLIVQGDNLDALKSLLPFYRGRVKCIYIDPPYNTGSAFEHYDDNLEHSTWLSMIPDDKSKTINRKIFLDEYKGQPISSLWTDISVINPMSNERLDFEGQKPVALIERILQIVTDKNSLVLDAFAGSGTTAHAVINLNAEDSGNRKFILIEDKDYCKTITAERVRRVGGNFNFYRLGAKLFDELGRINRDVTFQQLAAYIWYKFTKTPYLDETKSPLIGIHDGTAYYLLREPLTRKILETLPAYDGAKIIFGKSCRISAENLKSLGITFKQMPKDVR